MPLRQLIPLLFLSGALALWGRQMNSRPTHAEEMSTTVHFAIIGDYGAHVIGQGAAEQAVANLIASWQPDFIITTGDNNYLLGEAATIDANIGQYYADYIYPYTGAYPRNAGLNVNRFFPSLGNHDWYTANAAAFDAYFTLPGDEHVYDFVQGPVHFFALDSEPMVSTGVTSTQALWLQTQLAASTTPWQVVYMHHPPYSSGAAHGSTPLLQWPYRDWGADVVVSGHNHIYERVVVEGLPYFINGLGGMSIQGLGAPIPDSRVRYNADYGAMEVWATPLTMTLQFMTQQGVVIEQCTLWATPPANPPAPTGPYVTFFPMVTRDSTGGCTQ